MTKYTTNLEDMLTTDNIYKSAVTPWHLVTYISNPVVEQGSRCLLYWMEDSHGPFLHSRNVGYVKVWTLQDRNYEYIWNYLPHD